MSKKLTYEELEQRVRELEASQTIREQSCASVSIESIQAGVIVHAKDGTVIASNTAAQTLLGLTQAQMLGKEFLDLAWTFLREDGSPLPVEEYPVSRALATRKPVRNFVVGIQRHDKAEPIWVLITAIQELDENGDVTQVVSSFTDISSLKQSEEKHRSLFENMMQEVHLWKLVRDEQGVIQTWQLIEVNPAALKAWGRTRSEIIGKTADEIFSYNATEQFMPIVKRIFADGMPYTWEAYFSPTDRFYHMTSVPFGEYFISTGTDITDRKQAEMALQKNEQLLSQAEEIAEMGSWEWNVENDRVSWSDGLFKVFQRSPKEGAPEWVKQSEIYKKESHEKLSQAVEICVRDGTPYEIEVQAIRSNGKIRTCIARGKAERDSSGKVLRLVGTFNDITDRVETEQALKKSENLLRNIIDSSTDFIFVKDRNLKTILCNQIFARSVNKNPSDLIGKTDVENGWDPELVIGNPDKGIVGYQKYDLDALSGQIVQNTDVAIISDKTVFLDTIKIPLKDENNEILGVLGISRNITEQKKAEQALKASEEQFRTLVNESPFPIVVVDAASKHILHWSKSAQALFGHQPTTLAEWFALVYPNLEYRQKVISRLKPCLERAQHSKTAINTGEYHVTCRDGSVKICEIYAQSISGYLVLTNNDITERKEQERQLFERSQEFEKTLIGTNCGTWRHDHAFDRVYCDPRTQTMLGFTSAVVTFDEWFSNICPDDKNAVLELTLNGFAAKKNRINTSFRVLKNNQTRHIKMDTFVDYSEGNPKTTYGLVQDVTDYALAKELLELSQSRYRRLIDNLGDRFFMFSRNYRSGELLYLSSGFGSVFGIPISSALNQNFSTVINWCPGELEKLAEHHQELADGECEFQHGEYSIRSCILMVKRDI